MLNEKQTAQSSPRVRFRSMMREDILNAAISILQTQGFPALSMRTLAEAVGVRAPTLYDYFASKEDVLNAIFLKGVERLRGEFVDRIAGTRPGIERLRAIGEAYHSFAISNPVLFQLLFGKIDASYTPGKSQMDESKLLFDSLKMEVEEAIALGDVIQGDAEAISLTLWANVHGITLLQLGGFTAKCSTMDSDELVALSLDSILSGLIPRPDAS